ncbi:MAG: acetate/propionate family kinase [Gaiellaceae bacterium]
MNVLVVNAGSSSLKLRLLAPDDELLESHDLPADETSIAVAGRVDAVGHRIVHGGTRFREPVRIDDDLVRALRDLTELAPLHQPKSLAALEATTRAFPDVPAVACFDTAFHATLPDAAATYALPRELSERFDIRRYGFHGLSHAYASRRAAELLERPLAELRVVTCHLGAGASLAAVRGGRSVDTTMGFTPLEGLAMATRSGSVDPGLLLWLVDHEGVDPVALAHSLEHRSGMLGLAGTADMREVVSRAADGDAAARLAFDVYVHRLRAGIAAMVAAMNGVDALVFTGGVGEHSPEVRDAALEGLSFLGAVEVLVLEAREDLEIARQVRAVLST